MRKKHSKMTARQLTYAALIAAVYVVLTYLTNMLGLANGVIQCRLSEALCILPVFTVSAVPGLFIGCLISNMLCGGIVLDVIFGSIATLIGAAGTYFLSKKISNIYVLTLPAVIANTVIVSLVLKFAYGFNGAYLFFVATVGAGEIISCTFLGALLCSCLKAKKNIVFK